MADSDLSKYILGRARYKIFKEAFKSGCSELCQDGALAASEEKLEKYFCKKISDSGPTHDG